MTRPAYLRNGSLQTVLVILGLLLQGIIVIGTVSGRLSAVEARVETLQDDLKEIKGSLWRR